LEHTLKHIDAAFELMEYLKEFDKKVQKDHANKWNARTEGF
jgi:hypothetical protein